MRKMMLALMLGLCFIGYSQDPVARSVRFNALSEAEMNAIPSNKLQEGSVCYREDTDTLWMYNGSVWADTGKPLIDASSFSQNLDSGITNLQLLAEAVDTLTVIGGSGGATQLSDLTDVNTSTATNRNVLVADGTDWESRPLVEADISDLGTYIPTSDIIDEDNMSSDSNTKVPTQQSVKAYVDTNSDVFSSFLKKNVKVATTANITLSGLQTIDSNVLSSGDRVLVKNQTDASENGIYIASSGSWTRATDADDNISISGALVYVFAGGVNYNKMYRSDADVTTTVGVDDISFSEVDIYGSGGDLSSTDIDTYGKLNTLVADVTLTHNGLFDTFGELNAIVADATLVDTNDAQTLTNKTIDADNNTISNIGSAEITNQSITSADIQDEAIGAPLIATNAVSTNKIDDMAVTNAKVMDNTVLEPKLNITNAPTDNHILSYNAAGTNFTWVSPSFEVADIGAADKTLTSSDVHKFNYTDDTVIFTLDNGLSVGDELTFAVTDIDSIITVVPDTGVDIIGNGTEPIDGGFQIDSLNVGKVKKLASNLYYAMGYIKPYSPSVSLIVPTLDDINTKLYIDGREFAASSNGASVSPTDQSGNSTPLTSIGITKQTDSDSDPTFSFNGTSSRISLGNNFNFTAGVAQSIGIFISADGFGTGTRFSKRDDATGGSNDHFAIYNGYYYMGNNEGNPSFSSTTNVLITLTKTTGDVWYIYENGTQRATGAWTNETSTADLLIGAQVNGGGFSDYATGEIEVFFITDDFITNTEAGTIATEINTR